MNGQPHYVITLIWKNPDLIPGPNSEVGRKMREDGLTFLKYNEALGQAVAYSNLQHVARALVTLVYETHQATFIKGVRQ